MVKMPRLSVARSIFCDFTIGAMVTAIYLGESAVTCKNNRATVRRDRRYIQRVKVP